jgi:hypothetical protein
LCYCKRCGTVEQRLQLPSWRTVQVPLTPTGLDCWGVDIGAGEVISSYMGRIVITVLWVKTNQEADGSDTTKKIVFFSVAGYR